MPSDEISVYYRCQPEGEYLDSVINAHTAFILATTKAPLLRFPVPQTAGVIIEEKTQVQKDTSGQAGTLFPKLKHSWLENEEDADMCREVYVYCMYIL